MPTIVKNKRKLCETNLSDFSIEQIEGVPFFSRYRELERLMRKHIPTLDFNKYFAEPYENRIKKIIEWYYLPGSELPSNISELMKYNPEAYFDALSQRDSILNEIQSAIQTSGESERKYLNALLTGLESSESSKTTFFYDGHILFGVWGMKAKAGRDLENVIREDVLDHRVFTINYEVEGDAKLSFSDIRRKHGYRLTPSDVPQVTPADSWTFTQWKPDVPQGFTISDNTIFTAVCEKNEVPVDPVAEEHHEDADTENIVADSEDVQHETPDDPKYRVVFRSDEGGTLQGCTEYLKSPGEKVLAGEIPTPVPNDGFEFVGWEPQPEGYEVHSDTEFKARFREKEERHGLWGFTWFGRKGCLHALLNWLLLALGLLLLFMLLWCFVFDKCHFNLCGCDCNDIIPNNVIPPTQNDGNNNPTPDDNPIPHTGDVQILLSWSNLNDLDIACVDPQGNTVWYNNKTVPSGGVLDIDMNINGGIQKTNPIENIYWPSGSAPQGQYSVFLTYFSQNENSDLTTPYTVKVKHGDIVDTYTGTLTTVKQQVNICTFVID